MTPREMAIIKAEAEAQTERLKVLIRGWIDAAVADEREACARVVIHASAEETKRHNKVTHATELLLGAATAIRARGEKQ